MTALAYTRTQADDDLSMWERLIARLTAPALNLARPPRRISLAVDEFEPLPVSDGDREEYQFELMEAAGRLMDTGMNESDADALAARDLGCVEFWQYAKQVNAYCDSKRAYVPNDVHKMS